MKRAEIGTRDGNLYTCDDPRLSECCERDETFLCCEPEWEKILINQIWLVCTLLAIFLALVMVYVCYNRQEELFESDTAREAALRWKSRVQKAINQIWLVCTLLAIFLALVMVYVCYNRQEELFESDTAREAALRWKSRIQKAYTSLWSQGKSEDPRSTRTTRRYSKLPGDSWEQQTSADDQHV
ncbi:hypothetical protein PoB_001320200 [Plakobranchus ocellatus]|uniref:Uncharacterized protein n=1 Tax=Plakobranchus ocellatus TaxID=259542 RepID=A0AAV3YWH0_9GAST|nr:hypothetical protein PoB_001320200 [Plakobranchus ocellatus]